MQTMLTASGAAYKIQEFRRNEAIFRQGEAGEKVFYISAGRVKISVVNSEGKAAVVAMLGAGDFLGEDCMSGQRFRMGSAQAITATTTLTIAKDEMLRVLHMAPLISDRFIAYMLARNIRIEEDLVDQLFNSSEKRLARTLLLMARYGQSDESQNTTLPPISQETLAEIVGTTRARINFFMNKFRRLGFIQYNGVLQIHRSLLNVVLHK